MRNFFNSLSDDSRASFWAIVTIVLVAMIAFLSTNAFSQPRFPDGKEGYLLMQGLVKDSAGHKIRSGTFVTVKDHEDDSEDKIQIRGGQVNIALELNKEYTVTFISDGYQQKSIIVITDVDMSFRNYFFQFDVIMRSTPVPGKTVAEVFFDDSQNQFSYKLK